MTERLIQLRNELKLSQEKFASKINVKRTTISTYERTGAPLPDRIISDICREFNVSEDWLRNGNGPMFRPVKGINNEVAALVAKLIKDDTEDAEWVKYHFARYLQLPVEERKIFNATLKKLFAEVDGQ